jgi:hypothetical protein
VVLLNPYNSASEAPDDPVKQTPELVRTARALIASVREARDSLKETIEITANRIACSEELIRQTDETVAKWGTLAGRPRTESTSDRLMKKTP